MADIVERGPIPAIHEVVRWRLADLAHWIWEEFGISLSETTVGRELRALGYLACGVTDMRKGITGLAAQAQEVLKQKPASGAVFCYRGRRGDRLKLLFWDGQGFCLYYKVLEKGRFPWPSSADGTALRLTTGQLSMLWEGIDWRRPAWTAPPARVV